MLKERASLQRQTDQSHTSATVAVGTPRRVRSMAVGTNDYNVTADSVFSVPETVVEKIYSSSTKMRLQNNDDSPQRKLKMRQSRSDKVKADLVIPGDLIQKRYSDSCSNLSVMVTVTRKRSEQGQGDGRDLDGGCDFDGGPMTSTLLEEDGGLSRLPTGSGDAWRRREVVNDEDWNEKSYTRAEEKGGKHPRREKMSYKERGGGIDEGCQYGGKEDPQMVSFTCQTDEDLGLKESK